MAFLIDAIGPTVVRTFTFPDANATMLTSAAAVTPAQGGTGLTSYTVGDLLYASGATTFSKLADVAVGSVLVSGGVATAPAWSASPTLTSVLGSAGGSLVIQSANGQHLLLSAAGTAQVQLWANGTNWLTMNNAGTFYPVSDATNQLGGSSNRWTSLFLSTSLVVGTNPATAGEVRLTNGFSFWMRNFANTGNNQVMWGASNDEFGFGDGTKPCRFDVTLLRFGGDTSSFPALKRNGTAIDFRLADDSSYASLNAFNITLSTGGFVALSSSGHFDGPGTVATTGAFRLANNDYIYARNAANSADILMIGADSANTINVGGGNFRVLLQPGTQDIQWGKALVALGGGAAPTLGTIGGSGPVTAAQNSWMRVLDSSGAAFWVPAWK